MGLNTVKSLTRKRTVRKKPEVVEGVHLIQLN
jgi:hypothetical protein